MENEVRMISAPTEKEEPMAEYIERESVIESIIGEPTEAHYPSWYADKIKNIQAADVALVVHGRWKRYGRNLGKCSNCGEIVDIRYNYCPNCGAKMDEG